MLIVVFWQVNKRFCDCSKIWKIVNCNGCFQFNYFLIVCSRIVVKLASFVSRAIQIVFFVRWCVHCKKNEEIILCTEWIMTTIKWSNRSIIDIYFIFKIGGNLEKCFSKIVAGNKRVVKMPRKRFTPKYRSLTSNGYAFLHNDTLSMHFNNSGTIMIYGTLNWRAYTFFCVLQFEPIGRK